MERSLYFALINRDDLYDSYVQQRQRGRQSPPRARTPLEARVTQELELGPPRLSLKEPLLRILRRIRSRTARDAAPNPTPRPTRPVCFLVHHEKFVRFLDPVRKRMAADETLYLSSDPAVADHLSGLGRPHRLIDASPMRRGPTGLGLRGHEPLAAWYDAAHACFQDLRPAAVVICEGNHPYDELANRAAQDLNIPTVCIQQGWSPIVHNGFRHLSFTRMLVWGEGFKEVLAPYSPRQRFDVTGHPLLTPRPSGSKPAAPPAVGFFLQGTSRLIPPAVLDEFFELIHEAAKARAGVTVWVRPHPSASAGRERDLAHLPNVRLAPPETMSLRELLPSLTVACSVYSTTLLESAAMMLPVVAFNPTSMRGTIPDLTKLGVGVETQDRATALQAILRFLEDGPYRRSLEPAQHRFRNHFFAGVRGDGDHRIAQEIRRLASGRLRTRVVTAGA